MFQISCDRRTERKRFKLKDSEMESRRGRTVTLWLLLNEGVACNATSNLCPVSPDTYTHSPHLQSCHTSRCMKNSHLSLRLIDTGVRNEFLWLPRCFFIVSVRTRVSDGGCHLRPGVPQGPLVLFWFEEFDEWRGKSETGSLREFEKWQ